MLTWSFCHSPEQRPPQEAQDAVGQGTEQEPEPEGQSVRGGDAAEGDRQDEPEDGGNHAQRPAVTLLLLAPLVLNSRRRLPQGHETPYGRKEETGTTWTPSCLV